MKKAILLAILVSSIFITAPAVSVSAGVITERAIPTKPLVIRSVFGDVDYDTASVVASYAVTDAQLREIGISVPDWAAPPPPMVLNVWPGTTDENGVTWTRMAVVDTRYGVPIIEHRTSDAATIARVMAMRGNK